MSLPVEMAELLVQELHHAYDYNVSDRDRAIHAAEREGMPELVSFLEEMNADEYEEFAEGCLPASDSMDVGRRE